MYYSYDKLFSYNFLLGFVIGERGVGKSFNAKVMAIKRFLKTGEQFIYVRRYKSELDSALTTFWNDIQDNGYFDDLNLSVKKNKMLTQFMCDGKVCGYAIALSTSNILKSNAFPEVSLIIYDEFILDNEAGTHRYLKNEPQMVLDLFESVGRLRDNIRMIFLGNAINIYGNPFFAYFGLDLPYGSEFKTFKDGLIVVNYIKNDVYREVKRKSRFGRLIDGTVYGSYAIDNKSLRENFYFIKKRPANCKYYALLVINGTNYGLWYGSDGYLYISDRYDPNTLNKFACDFDDHTDQTIFLSLRENYYLRICVKCYKQGCLMFESQRIKTQVLPLINKCIAL